ncbi:MAG: hypothetical protein ABR528_04830 [Pseudonocardiaceae bacterium]
MAVTVGGEEQETAAYGEMDDIPFVFRLGRAVEILRHSLALLATRARKC